MAQKRSRVTFEADLQARQSPYALYGTPLPVLDPQLRDDGSFVPVWKQEVTDERGRKRLHGAFTGGFSAGYFNTVGSKEGWTPSTFRSTRADRKKDADRASQQRPEDFMDEEDLADAEEAKRLQTSESFAGLGSTANDVAYSNGLMDILKAGGETMGVKLLRRMGWRDGQGVGAKVRRKARPENGNGLGGGDERIYGFAPENSPMMPFVRKDDYKGLGFERESRLAQSTISMSDGVSAAGNNLHDYVGLDSSSVKVKRTKKKETSRGGFGVGILNDNGSDDEDPYQMGPQVSHNREIGTNKKKSKKPESERLTVGSANPLLGSKPVFISKKAVNAKASAGFRRCHDGRLPLDGFVLSRDTDALSSIVGRDGKYPPPEIPSDWKSSKKPEVARDTSSYLSTAEAAKAQRLDPTARASLLGEVQLPGKSVFDFLTPSARTRIASASGKTNLPAALAEAAPKGFGMTDEDKQKELWSLVPKTDRDVAIRALGRGIGGWMPYAEDEAKRARYRAFLEIRAGLQGDLPERTVGMSKDDWAKELNEFAHAAQIFKPMTGMMATRFTSSNVPPKQASDAPEQATTQQLLSKPSEKPQDPAEAAAKVGMYGPMTRSIQQFLPSRLLCKRFNVKPPAHVQLDPEMAREEFGGNGDNPGSRFSTGGYETRPSALPTTKLELVSKETLENIMRESGGRQQACTETGIDFETQLDQKRKDTKRKDIIVDAERNEALESQRPGDAVFKAIFGSDNEDDND
ncbi:MAG: hypothetical protein M1830_008923 [Pleopsidium flavum]|nr:MAG: hypothetical protein M1830_008923 [Pleopsidium flavum]